MKHLPTLSMLFVGLVSYLLFLVAAIYGVSYTLGGLLPDPFAIPHTIPILAFLIDLSLMLLFGVQHTIMARARWKKMWTTIIPPTLERSLYVLIASCVLLALFWCWQPIPNVIWRINYLPIRAIVTGVCLIGWGLVVLSTFQIDHFELFGLRQIWHAMRNRPQPAAGFRLPFLYRFVRHPMMVGFLLAFWFTPTMTVDRLLFALGMTVYILIGIAFEERALRQEFGATYERYQTEVPRLIPHPRKPRDSILMPPGYRDSGSVPETDASY